MAVRNHRVRRTFEDIRIRLAEQVDLQFATELAALPEGQAPVRAAMIDAVCQFETIDQLRTRLRWSKRTTTAVLEETVAHLLVPPLGSPDTAGAETES